MTNPKLEPLGWVWVAWSAITSLAGLLVAAMALGIGGLVTVVPDSNTGEPAPWWLGAFFGTFGVVIGGLVLVMGAVGIAAGFGLRKAKPWAMIAACVLGFFQLSSFPLGTALAAWTFWAVATEWGKPEA